DRGGLVHPLAGEVRDELGESQAPVEAREGEHPTLPAVSRLEERLPGLVDAELRHLRVGEEGPERAQVELERGARGGLDGNRRARHGADPGAAACVTRNAYTELKSTSRATNTWMRSPCALVTVGGTWIVPRRTSVMTSPEVEGLTTTEPLRFWELTAPWTAPFTTPSRIAAPKRSQQ